MLRSKRSYECGCAIHCSIHTNAFCQWISSLNSIRNNNLPAAFYPIYSFFSYSFDSLGCFVQLWLWLLTIDTKWSFRFLCFLQLSTIEPVPIRIRAQFYVHRETIGSFIEKRPSSSKIIFSLYRIKNIKIVFGRFRLGMFEKLRLFWCVRFFKS